MAVYCAALQVCGWCNAQLDVWDGGETEMMELCFLLIFLNPHHNIAFTWKRKLCKATFTLHPAVNTPILHHHSLAGPDTKAAVSAKSLFFFSSLYITQFCHPWYRFHYSLFSFKYLPLPFTTISEIIKKKNILIYSRCSALSEFTS